VRHGATAVVSELAAQLAVTKGTAVEIKTLLSEGATVMVEEISTFTISGSSISAVVMAVFEFDPTGRITRWREAYDLKSLTDQIEAARA
jgi:limonene-1,2-epoxide hydrolase